MIRNILVFVVANYAFTMFVFGFVAAGIVLAGKPHPLNPGVLAETLFAYFLLFNIGLGYLANFVMHVFFGEVASRFIGWPWSPFETEVGFASLGFSLVGLLAFRGSRGLRIAAIVGPSMFLLGAAGGHVYQMIVAHNFEPGNAGLVFYMDIIIPIVGVLLLWMTKPVPNSEQPTEVHGP
jgi:hypothetical protein